MRKTRNLRYRYLITFYLYFFGSHGNIIQKAQFANCIGAAAAQCPANNAPVGTGPYKLREFKPGDVIMYDINEQYRDPNKPFFKEVQLKGGGNARMAAQAVFETGEADYA